MDLRFWSAWPQVDAGGAADGATDGAAGGSGGSANATDDAARGGADSAAGGGNDGAAGGEAAAAAAAAAPDRPDEQEGAASTAPGLQEPEDNEIRTVHAGDTPYTSAASFDDLPISQPLLQARGAARGRARPQLPGTWLLCDADGVVPAVCAAAGLAAWPAASTTEPADAAGRARCECGSAQPR